MKGHLSLAGALVALAMILTLAHLPVRALQPQTILRLQPEVTKIQVGAEAQVDVAIEGVTGLYGAQIRVSFDPDVLEVVDADPSQSGTQIEPGTLPSPDYVVRNSADNQAGIIDYALTQLQPTPPGSGSGRIARIVFRGRTMANSEIRLDQYLLVNEEGRDIVARVQHAQVRVMRASTWILILAAGAAVLLLVGGGVGFAVKKGK